ncbi:MAG: peptidoglycan D,D-transpeptidase FtsI family protein [Saprospiraceae bacterium]
MATRDIYQERQLVIKGLFILMGLVLTVKALFLQVLDRDFQRRASATGIDKVVVNPGRGLIYDRNNKLMLNNEALYDIMVTYNELNPQMDTAKICRLLQITKEEFVLNINKDFKNIRYSKAKPYLFLSKVSPEVCTRFQEYLYEFPGFSIDLKNVRSYPYNCAAQVLGYISEVGQKNIDDSKGQYVKGDIIGSTGLEFEYEQFIKGTKGISYLLKNNFGRPLGSYRGGIADSMAVAGKDMISSIDIELQQYGEELMAGKSGSIVAIEPETGDILAMISAPTYDPNLLAINKNRGQFFKELQADTRKPFFDRTVMAKYPPGSIFKPLVALIGLQEGVLSINRGIVCGGGFHYNNLTVKCVHNHGYLKDVAHGIGESCNNYFCTVFKDIIDKYGFSNARQGYQGFINHLYDFGLGKPLDLDYPNEKGGNVPSVAYYDKLYPKDRGGWYSTTIISMGIGQGEIQMTTIQMANLAATIANRGYFYTPHLIKKFTDGTPIPVRFLTRRQTRIQAQHFEPVIDGMELVVMSGTARNAQIPGISIVGKTGTVQNPQNKNKDHSVFYGFAPKYNPKIAVAAYIEYGGWGSTVGAPIASLLIEKYLKGTVSRKDMETRIKQKVLSNYDN